MTLSDKAAEQARRAGVNLPGLVARALDHIDALLAGPKTTIAVDLAPPGKLVPQTGSAGDTSALTGRIRVAFGPTPQVSIEQALTLGLPRALSHEVDHSVRVLAGPGAGQTLLAQTILEGLSSVFDEVAFTGPPNPWNHVLSQTQECALWTKAQSELGLTGLYNLWMYGGPGVPHWTGFVIGYHIVKDYRDRHPQMSWSELTSASASTILLGSHYQPCTR